MYAYYRHLSVEFKLSSSWFQFLCRFVNLIWCWIDSRRTRFCTEQSLTKTTLDLVVVFPPPLPRIFTTATDTSKTYLHPIIQIHPVLTRTARQRFFFRLYPPSPTTSRAHISITSSLEHRRQPASPHTLSPCCPSSPQLSNYRGWCRDRRRRVVVDVRRDIFGDVEQQDARL
ncbi:hypothetical protein BJ165DRAFT_233690 [Panaeolus papilionaceus]|nr:hypothetical protein BJ165DRAFT_233690 [Panaeolus papilionaceus]